MYHIEKYTFEKVEEKNNMILQDNTQNFPVQ